MTELGSYVKRAEAREHLGAYLRGLLGDVERRNRWQLAEHQGIAHPYGFQHLINRARYEGERWLGLLMLIDGIVEGHRLRP